MSIGETLASLFNNGLLTYEQVIRFAGVCGGVFDQWSTGDDDTVEAYRELNVRSFWQLSDYSYMEERVSGKVIVGDAPNGYVHLEFNETPDQMAEKTDAILQLLRRIANGEPAAWLTPRDHAARACE